MTLAEFINKTVTEHGPTILLLMTMVEVAPIKINPWKWIFKTIGNLVFGEIRKEIKETREEIKEIREELAELKRESEEDKAKEKRWHILGFVNSCRRGGLHTREEWNHAISELTDYEVYCKLKKITNGVIEEDAKYLRQLFYERNRKNDFL